MTFKNPIFFLILKLLFLNLFCISMVRAEEKEEAKPQKPSPSSKEKKKVPPKVTEEQLIAKEIIKNYVHIPVFQIPVIQNRVHKSNFMLEIMIESYDHEKAMEIYTLRAKLIDAILVDLYSVFAVIWSPQFNVELTDLKERIYEICLKVLGPKLFKDVLVQKFASQRSQLDKKR